MTLEAMRWEMVPYTRGKVRQIGGDRPLFPHFALDDGSNGGSFVVLVGKGDDAEAAIRAWDRVGEGCHLVVCQQDAEAFVGGPDDSETAFDKLIPGDEGEGRFVVFRKHPYASRFRTWECQPAADVKRACVVRYGGFGDMIQASNILPALKREGYHVTVMTTPKGANILAEDPHVDCFYLQDTDQVPNHELGDFWAYVGAKFDKFINLSESVEGTLLAIPGRANYQWPDNTRRQFMGTINYLEFASLLADVPYASEARFYPTEGEAQAAKARLLDGGLNVLWSLAGSSIHKFTPHQDAVIARILLAREDCRIFLVGDVTCKLLEQGWENEPRVVRLSGDLPIRDTMALAQVCDIVIGCETGVLNAVAFEPNRKVCMLSHSSHENLTKHWRNTFAIGPQNLPCFPCHRLHYTSEHCHIDEETGAALCQALIGPEAIYGAIADIVDGAK